MHHASNATNQLYSRRTVFIEKVVVDIILKCWKKMRHVSMSDAYAPTAALAGRARLAR